MLTRSPHWERECIELMEHALARGSMRSLATYVSSYESMYVSEGSQASQLKLANLKRCLLAGEQYESEHGDRSLLDAQHPFNQYLVEKGYIGSEKELRHR